MALGLCVTEMAVSLNLSRPYIWLAEVTASLKTCSYLFWLRTAPMFTIFGSQPARAQEHERSTAYGLVRRPFVFPGEGIDLMDG